VDGTASRSFIAQSLKLQRLFEMCLDALYIYLMKDGGNNLNIYKINCRDIIMSVEQLKTHCSAELKARQF
jgi:hypothetical protein